MKADNTPYPEEHVKALAKRYIVNSLLAALKPSTIALIIEDLDKTDPETADVFRNPNAYSIDIVEQRRDAITNTSSHFQVYPALHSVVDNISAETCLLLIDDIAADIRRNYWRFAEPWARAASERLHPRHRAESEAVK